MKKSLRYYFYKLNFLAFLKNLRSLSKKEKIIYAIVSFLILGVIISIFYFSNFLVEVTYDPEIEKTFSKNTLFVFIVIPLLLVFFSFIVLFRVLLAFVKKKSFQQLKFKFMGFYFIGIFIPATFYIVLFEESFDRFVNIVDNQAVIKSLEVKLLNLRLFIREKQEALDQESLSRISNKVYTKQSDDLADIFINYDKDLKPIFILKEESIKNIPRINFELFLDKQDSFSSYNEKEGFIFNLYKIPNLTNPYFLAIDYVEKSVESDIQETLKLINETKQFQDTLPAFKNAIFFVFLYIFIQMFSIIIIFFYYRFTKYFSPIDRLSKSTIALAQGDFNPPYLAELRRNEKNEFSELITAFHSLVIELRTNRKRLKRLSEIEAWREIIRRLAHEIKNPLTPIKLSTNQIEESILKKDIQMYERLNNNFNFIYSEVSRIENLIKDISLFPKFSLNQKKNSMKEIFSKIENYLAQYPAITFKKEISATATITLFIDEEKIYQAVLNLVKNAVESLTSSNQKDKTIVITTKMNVIEESKKYFEIKIKDNGEGIASEKKEEIFKPYVTTKKSGTGLGLSISEEIIHLHYGKIDLASDNHWTTFKIYLPIKE